MSKLSPKEHWDSVHVRELNGFSSESAARVSVTHKRPLKKRLAEKIKRLIGSQTLARMTAYDDYLLWEVIFSKYLPSLKGTKVVEIGSAPGEFLVKFGQRYGCNPYGVDYSETGVDVNRRVFEANGFDAGNVMQADFFSEEFQRERQGKFDVVISRGFIEHFSDVDSVITNHLNLLAPGGLLIVSVPNLRGVNHALIRLLDKKVIAIHNLEIMRKQRFAKLFNRDELAPLFCNHYGTFSFYIFTAGSTIQRSLLRLAQKLQPLLNLLFRITLKEKGAESGLFSPSLLYIGRKKVN